MWQALFYDLYMHSLIQSSQQPIKLLSLIYPWGNFKFRERDTINEWQSFPPRQSGSEFSFLTILIDTEANHFPLLIAIIMCQATDISSVIKLPSIRLAPCSLHTHETFYRALCLKPCELRSHKQDKSMRSPEERRKKDKIRTREFGLWRNISDLFTFCSSTNGLLKIHQNTQDREAWWGSLRLEDLLCFLLCWNEAFFHRMVAEQVPTNYGPCIKSCPFLVSLYWNIARFILWPLVSGLSHTTTADLSRCKTDHMACTATNLALCTKTADPSCPL